MPKGRLASQIASIAVVGLFLATAAGITYLVLGTGETEISPLPNERFLERSFTLLITNRSGKTIKVGKIQIGPGFSLTIQFSPKSHQAFLSGNGQIRDLSTGALLRPPLLSQNIPVKEIEKFLKTPYPPCRRGETLKEAFASLLPDKKEHRGLLLILESTARNDDSTSSTEIYPSRKGRYRLELLQSGRSLVQAAPTHVRRGLMRYTCEVGDDDRWVNALEEMLARLLPER